MKFTNVQEWIEYGLQQTVLEIVFTKKNGDERTMLCTTNFAFIPENDHPKSSETNKSDSTKVKRVYDLDIGAWRSFAWDSVKSVTYVK